MLRYLRRLHNIHVTRLRCFFADVFADIFAILLLLSLAPYAADTPHVIFIYCFSLITPFIAATCCYVIATRFRRHYHTRHAAAYTLMPPRHTPRSARFFRHAAYYMMLRHFSLLPQLLFAFQIFAAIMLFAICRRGRHAFSFYAAISIAMPSRFAMFIFTALLRYVCYIL